MQGQGGTMNRNSVLPMAKFYDAVAAISSLYRRIHINTCRHCPTLWMALRVTRASLTKRVQDLGIPNPELKRPSTGEVALLSDWICDYMELTSEEWGGDYFADAGLIEVHTVNGENH